MKKLEKLLWEGINTNDLKKVTWALNLGADVNAKTNDGSTPLHWVGSAVVAKLLIESGADVQAVNDWGFTPLHWASWGGHTETVNLLIEAGADVNAKGWNGETPLYWANSEEMKALLIEHGAKK